jgi:hypothetical protein
MRQTDVERKFKFILLGADSIATGQYTPRALQGRETDGAEAGERCCERKEKK